MLDFSKRYLINNLIRLFTVFNKIKHKIGIFLYFTDGNSKLQAFMVHYFVTECVMKLKPVGSQQQQVKPSRSVHISMFQQFAVVNFNAKVLNVIINCHVTFFLFYLEDAILFLF